MRLDLRGGEWRRALQGSRCKNALRGEHAFPIVPADIGLPDHDVSVNVNRGRQDDFRVGNKRGRTLGGGGAWTQIVVDVVEGAHVPVAGAMAPVIDDIVPEITLHRNIAPTWHAALHVGEEVVVPGAAVAAHTG